MVESKVFLELAHVGGGNARKKGRQMVAAERGVVAEAKHVVAGVATGLDV